MICGIFLGVFCFEIECGGLNCRIDEGEKKCGGFGCGGLVIVVYNVW